jgi:hypothetical protein
LPSDDFAALLYNPQIYIPTDHNQSISSIDGVYVAADSFGSVKNTFRNRFALGVVKHHNTMIEVHIWDNRINIQTRLLTEVPTIDEGKVQYLALQ